MALKPVLVTAELAAIYAAQQAGRPVAPATVRVWAHRHPEVLQDHGRRGRQRLYNLLEIHQLVRANAA